MADGVVALAPTGGPITMKAAESRGRSAKGNGRGTKEATITARPVPDDGSPVAVAPPPGARGAPGLFTRFRQEILPAREEVTPRFFGPQHTFENRVKRGLGWIRDTPDLRDMTLDSPAPVVQQHKESETLFKRVSKTLGTAGRAVPTHSDNRAFCSPVEDQGQLGSCTANACMGMVEYMERRSGGQYIDGSRLFLYKATRKLLGWTGDTGAFLRTTMKALVHFGVPPEEVWPYEVSTFDNEPDPFMYAYAANTKAIRYLRLDPANSTPAETLKDIKLALSHGYVVMFGFSVYSSMTTDPDIPFPSWRDQLDGGHAVLAVGHDDEHPCKGPGPNKKGALLIRNSWGLDWGDAGYGWLPYDYVLSGLASDFWTCFQLAWIESGQFD
jgi:C1A family cysteine protease